MFEISIVAGRAVGGVADAVLRALGVPTPRLLFGRRGGFDERLEEITTQLHESSNEAQLLLEEMQTTITERSKAVAAVQARVDELREQEKSAREDLAKLEATKPEAAQAFNRLVGEALDQRDKRSSRRDLVIFILGLVVSAVISVIIQVGYGFYIGDLGPGADNLPPTPSTSPR